MTLRDFIPCSLTLLTLAAIVPEEVEVDVVDENFQDIDFDVSYDLVGITSTTPQSYRTYKIARRFRDRGVPVVIGGSHATLLPDDVLPHADVIFTGEAEETLPKLLQDLKNGSMKKRYDGGSAVLSKSPLPEFGRIDEIVGRETVLQTKMFPVSIQVTRGCPYNCNFCSVSRICGSKHRRKSIPQVVREIEAILDRYSADEISLRIEDDNLFIDRKFAWDLFLALKQYKLKIYCLADISIAEDGALLSLLSSAGCQQIAFGLESLGAENLKLIEKFKLKYLPKYGEYINKIQDAGISACTYFVFGWDYDTLDTFARTFDFVKDNQVNYPVYFVATPYPKTRFEQQLVREGRLLTKDYWDKCNLFNVLFTPKNMSYKELEEHFYKIYFDTYGPILSVASSFSDLTEEG